MFTSLNHPLSEANRAGIIMLMWQMSQISLRDVTQFFQVSRACTIIWTSCLSVYFSLTTEVVGNSQSLMKIMNWRIIRHVNDNLVQFCEFIKRKLRSQRRVASSESHYQVVAALMSEFRLKVHSFTFDGKKARLERRRQCREKFKKHNAVESIQLNIM